MADRLEWMRDRFQELREYFNDQPEITAVQIAAPFLVHETEPTDRFVLHIYSGVEVSSGNPDGEVLCQLGAFMILEILAHGHETLIRKMPKPSIHTDFVTNESKVSAFVRFAVSEREGEWTLAEVPEGMAIFGSKGL